MNSAQPCGCDPAMEYECFVHKSGYTGWDVTTSAGTTPVRTFDTGATRDTEEGKLDYEGFLSPLVLERYAQYMHKHRLHSDGTLRASDNWTKGIPVPVYMKSLIRHVMDVWLWHRGRRSIDIQESLAAVMFNTMGMLHALLQKEVL